MERIAGRSIAMNETSTRGTIRSSFAPSEVIAAMLLAQLERVHDITEARHALWTRYHSALAPLKPPDLLAGPSSQRM
jgi:dTDP-4-amino-4,6-dideoxygalactose transaminase